MTLLTLAVVGVQFTSICGSACRWHSKVFVFMASLAIKQLSLQPIVPDVVGVSL